MITNRFWTIARSFMPAELAACASEILNPFNDNRCFNTQELSVFWGFNKGLLERFVMTCLALGIVERKRSDSEFALSDTAPNYDNLTISLLDIFRVCDKSASSIDWSDHEPCLDSAIKEFSLDRAELDSAIKADVIRSRGGSYFLASDLKDYFNPTSISYAATTLNYYDRVASVIFKKEFIVDALKTGKTQWQNAFGANVGDVFGLAEVAPAVFYELMFSMHIASLDEFRILTKKYNFSSAKRLLDIGGASSAWGMALIETYSSVEEIVNYELTSAIPIHKKVAALYEIAENPILSTKGGDFFENDATAGFIGLDSNLKFEVIHLGWILHDWQDPEALVILQKARRYISATGSLHISEVVMSDSRDDLKATMLDMTMMLHTGGKERTLGEYSKLLEQSGFKLQEVISANTRRSLIVARPAEFPGQKLGS